MMMTTTMVRYCKKQKQTRVVPIPVDGSPYGFLYVYYYIISINVRAKSIQYNINYHPCRILVAGSKSHVCIIMISNMTNITIASSPPPIRSNVFRVLPVISRAGRRRRRRRRLHRARHSSRPTVSSESSPSPPTRALTRPPLHVIIIIIVIYDITVYRVIIARCMYYCCAAFCSFRIRVCIYRAVRKPVCANDFPFAQPADRVRTPTTRVYVY